MKLRLVGRHTARVTPARHEDDVRIAYWILARLEEMPILAEETALYPNDLLDGAGVTPDHRRWWAIYTKARQEKSLARQLLRFRVPFYLPLVPRTRLHRGRRLRSHIPLFTGYLFVFGSDEQRVRCLTTNRISQVLAVPDQHQLYRDLRQVRQLICSGAALTVERQLESGRRVRIREGSLRGLEGIVLSRRGESRLVVAVNFLQQGVSVEIEDFLLDPLD